MLLPPDHYGCGLGCTRFTGTLAAVEEHERGCAHWLHNLLPEGLLHDLFSGDEDELALTLLDIVGPLQYPRSSGCPPRDGAVLTIYNSIPKSTKGSCGRMTPRRQYGNSELVEAARYAAPGETGCFFPPARHGSGDCLADAPFTILKAPVKLSMARGFICQHWRTVVSFLDGAQLALYGTDRLTPDPNKRTCCAVVGLFPRDFARVSIHIASRGHCRDFGAISFSP